jgi:DMSO/TMAO reductase YedYZ molybdopterin-dependent catalytic subunit
MKTLKPVIFIAVLSVALFAGCAAPVSDVSKTSIDAASGATKSRFREGEITEYEGFKLDPAIGPRDNSINGVQQVDIDTYKLEISGLVDTPVELTYEDVLQLDAYERKITLYCVEGWNATILWKGVLIEDILDQAGIGEEANTVIFHSVDGYTTSLPLETVISNQLILAYNANDLPLPDEMGYPFIVVAESKLGYKWARWVSGIELSDDPEYLGYWEQRGFDNSADLNYQQFSQN